MSGRAAHIEVANRSAVARPYGYRTQEEKLLERKFALKNIAFGEADAALDIERRLHLTADDDVFQIRGVLGDGVHHRVAEGFALLVPVETRLEFVRRVLHEAGEHVLARRRDG